MRSISLWQYFLLQGRREAFGLLFASKHKVPETLAKLERYLAEPWYTAANKPNPGKDLIPAIIHLSGI